MENLVFLNPNSLDDLESLALALEENRINGNDYVLCVASDMKSKAIRLADALSYSTNFFGFPESSTGKNLLIQNKLEALARHIQEGKSTIFIEHEEVLAAFTMNFLKIRSGFNKDSFGVVYNCVDGIWNENQILLNSRFTQAEQLEINSLIPIQGKYADIVIQKSFQATKNKIKAYEQLKRGVLQGKLFVNAAMEKLDKSNVGKILQTSADQQERIKKQVFVIADSVAQAKCEIEKINEILIKKIPNGSESFKPLDLTSFIRPTVKFPKDAIFFSEVQSENRTYHEFTITNKLDIELKNLKIVIKNTKKSLCDFSLSKHENKKLKVPHEYDLLSELGTLTCEIISCSFLISNSIQIPLLEISLKSSQKLVVFNRFTTQKNCDLRIDGVSYQCNFNIIHFNQIEIQLVREILPSTSLSVYSEKGLLISNILIA